MCAEDNPREAPKLDDRYIAGILDGEGSISIARNKRRARKFKYSYQVSVSIYNSHKGLIDAIFRRYPGRIFIRQPRPANGNDFAHGRIMYQWNLASKNGAKQFIKNVLPHLIVKRNQALVALEFWDGWTQGHRRHGVSTEQAEHRERMYQRMKLLNAGAPAETKRENTQSSGEAMVQLSQ